MKAIIGLGNPGAKYEETRHNIGFKIIDSLAKTENISSFRNWFKAETAQFRFRKAKKTVKPGKKGKEAVASPDLSSSEEEQIILVKPQTFMNLSGQSVRELVDFYKLNLSDLLVICDDLALPLGKLRVRSQGSHGGQNGLKNIQELLGSQNFSRLRFGIDSPGPYIDAADYVLSRFKPAEKNVVEDGIIGAVNSVYVWLNHGIEQCMNTTNGDASK